MINRPDKRYFAYLYYYFTLPQGQALHGGRRSMEL
jgi:hypothetical protein